MTKSSRAGRCIGHVIAHTPPVLPALEKLCDFTLPWGVLYIGGRRCILFYQFGLKSYLLLLSNFVELMVTFELNFIHLLDRLSCDTYFKNPFTQLA